MRILRLNGVNVNIDEKTAIGITLQAYDFKTPGKRRINISNSFTIPLTSNNQKIIGFSNNVQTTSNVIYDVFYCDYWIDNKHLIIDSKIRIEEITHDRIKLFIVQKNDFWEEIKKDTWVGFLDDYYDWLRLVKGIHLLTIGGNNIYTGTFSGLVGQYIDTESELIIPYYFGNLFNYEHGGEGTGFTEDESNLYLDYFGNNGGHVCSYVKTIFEYLEYKYNIEFLVNSVNPNDFWNDNYVKSIYIPMRNLRIITYGGLDKWLFSKTDAEFAPYGDIKDKGDKTIYDFVQAFMQLFNVIIDEKIINNITTFKLYRFDDIKTKAEIVNFSDRLDLTKTKFKPKIPGYKQINRIKYAVTYPNANKYAGAKELVCNNKNLDEVQDLFEIDAYYPNAIENTNLESVTNLSTEESFETFVFLISNGATTDLINIKSGSFTASNKLQISVIYSISGEYNFMEEIIAYPKFYEIQKWLTISDIINLEFFKQYHVKQLNGSFFINKISGFNPEKSNKPTKIELIRISDKTPIPEYLTEYFVDGFEDAFVDGTGDYFT